MITKEEFTSKLDAAGLQYIFSANTVVVESSKTLMFSFENNILTSFVSGYEMRRLFNVKKVEASSTSIAIEDGGTRYEITL